MYFFSKIHFPLSKPTSSTDFSLSSNFPYPFFCFSCAPKDLDSYLTENTLAEAKWLKSLPKRCTQGIPISLPLLFLQWKNCHFPAHVPPLYLRCHLVPSGALKHCAPVVPSSSSSQSVTSQPLAIAETPRPVLTPVFPPPNYHLTVPSKNLLVNLGSCLSSTTLQICQELWPVLPSSPGF